MDSIAEITERILDLRGKRVLLAADLARLYGVETRVLIQAVRRNPGRFPADFAFPIAKQELANLRSQTVISSWGGDRAQPIAFTEHGALMRKVGKHDRTLAEIIAAIRQLTLPTEAPRRRRIGFV